MRLFALLLILGLVGSQARAIDAILTDDLSVSTRPGSPKSNPRSPRLRVSERDVAFIKFDLDQVLPASVTSSRVEKACVIVWVNSVSTPGGAIVHRVLSPIGEISPPTGANLPSLEATIPFLNIQRRRDQFLVIDVTEMVKDWLNGVPNHGIAIRGELLGGADVAPVPAARFSIDSKENPATSHSPRLQILISGAQ